MLRWVLGLGLAWQTVSPEAAQHVRAGMEAQKQGRMSEAISEFRKVTELAPELAAAFVNLGAAYMQDHQYGAAIGPLKRAVELNADLVGAHQMLGYALLIQGYPAESIAHFERAQVQDGLGIAQEEVGKYPEAIANLEGALAQRPNDPDLLYYLGRASGLLSKGAFDTLESAYPDSARAHQVLGENYAAMRRVPEAEKEYLAALKLRGDAPGIHMALGQMYAGAGRWAEAAGEFDAESKLQPGSAEAAYRLGEALLEQGKVKQARGELQRADGLGPGMPETLYALGKAASLDGDGEGAEKAWRQVLGIEKSGTLAAQAHFGLATLYHKQGKPAEAEREMEEFRKQQSGTQSAR